MRLRIAVILALSALLTTLGVATSGTAGAAASPRGSTYAEAFFPSGDGTMLHAEYLLPSTGCDTVVNANGSTGCPTIVSMGPYFGSGAQGTGVLPYGSITNSGVSNRFFDFNSFEFVQPDGTTKNIFEMGYAWVQVDSRGFGSSGGCNDYGGHGEQMDMAAAVTWAGTQPWSSGHVGTWGKSYDAWTQVMGLAENPPHLDAAIIQAPLIEGYGIGYINGVHHSATWYATTELYALYDYSPNAIGSTPEEHLYPLSGSATDPCWAKQNAFILNADHSQPYWQERDLRPRASRNDDVAVFWTHGFTDVQTKPNQIFDVYNGLNHWNGDQTRAWFGQWDHRRGSDVRNDDVPAEEDTYPHDDWVLGRAGWNYEVLDWLNHYLRGDDFAYTANEDNIVEVQDNEGQWRTESRYPSVDVQRVTLPITGGTYSDTASSTGFWTVSEEVTTPFRIEGESTVTIDVTTTVPFANFIGVLYEIEGTRAEEIGRSFFRIPGTGTYTFNTQPGDWLVNEGSKLGFKIMSAHGEAFPYPTGQTVTVNSAGVTIQVPTYEREVNLGGTETSNRVLYTQTVSGTVNEVDWDLDALAPLPYPDQETRDWVQGPEDVTTPFE